MIRDTVIVTVTYTTIARLFFYFAKSNSSFTLVDLIFLLILSIHVTSYLILSIHVTSYLILSIHVTSYLILPKYLHDHSYTFLIFLQICWLFL